MLIAINQIRESGFLSIINVSGIIHINIEKSNIHSNNGVLSIRFSIAIKRGPKIPYRPRILGISVLYKTIIQPIKNAAKVNPPKARYDIIPCGPSPKIDKRSKSRSAEKFPPLYIQDYR